MTAIREIITFEVIISFKNKNPKITPKIGIKYATCAWKTKPLFFNIRNLNNQAIPVAKIPR